MLPLRIRVSHELEKQFMMDRSSSSHALVVAGIQPRWLSLFRERIPIIYPNNPISINIICGVVDIFESIFSVHPGDVYHEPGDSLETRLQNLGSMEKSVELYIEKVNELQAQDVRTLPDYQNLFRIYCRVVSFDTLDPIKRVAVSILISVKRQKAEIFWKMSRQAELLSEAVEMRRRAEIMRSFVATAKRFMPPTSRKWERAVSKPIPSRMSPLLARCFADIRDIRDIRSK